MISYPSFIGIDKWSDESQKITKIYGLIRMIRAFVMSLTSTFFILYIINAIGYEKTSIIVTIMLFVQLATDYPTGSLGDLIGQKWVFGCAIFLDSIEFFCLAFATTFVNFILIAILSDFASGQSSGELESWYDNNYKKSNQDNDPEKKNYGYTMNRLNAADNFVIGITIIIGGFLATILGRPNVFTIEGILAVVMTVFILKNMNDIENNTSNEINEQKNNLKYLDKLKGGIHYVFHSKINVLLVMGLAIFQFAWTIWWNLILFPIYFGYTGSDSYAGLLRSIIFFIEVGIIVAISGITKKFNKRKVTLFFSLQSFLLFGGYFYFSTLFLCPINYHG